MTRSDAHRSNPNPAHHLLVAPPRGARDRRALATAIGFVLATREAGAIAGVVAIAAAAMAAVAWRRAEHSLVGELIATIALPGASAPAISIAVG